MNESKKKIVTLTITHACNLQCSYCYEHHKTGDQMEFAIAKSIIDREIETITDEDEIEFDLFGGEPFIAFDIEKESIPIPNAYMQAVSALFPTMKCFGVLSRRKLFVITHRFLKCGETSCMWIMSAARGNI